MRKFYLNALGLFFIASPFYAQQRVVEQRVVIAFWNIENFYDTLDDPMKNDNDFLPEGSYHWNGERFRTKLDRVSEVFSKIGLAHNADGPAIIGLCETENRQVVEAIAQTPLLKERHYRVIHIEGPDARGVDPSFMYNVNYFAPTNAVAYKVRLKDSLHATRDILVVSGKLVGESFCFLINHWPSRRGGERASMPGRCAAAKVARRIIDSVEQKEPSVKVILMGDLNDDPVSPSVRHCLGATDQLKHLQPGSLYNPSETLYKQGVGTLAWADSWSLFDQTIINWSLVQCKKNSWTFYKAYIFNDQLLRADYGSFKGYPFRTYSGGAYTGGYSDHFPAYVVLRREQPIH